MTYVLVYTTECWLPWQLLVQLIIRVIIIWIQGMSLSEHSLNTGVIRKVSLWNVHVHPIHLQQVLRGWPSVPSPFHPLSSLCTPINIYWGSCTNLTCTHSQSAVTNASWPRVIFLLQNGVKVFNGTPVPVFSEKDIFKYLDIEYREPKERDWD